MQQASEDKDSGDMVFHDHFYENPLEEPIGMKEDAMIEIMKMLRDFIVDYGNPDDDDNESSPPPPLPPKLTRQRRDERRNAQTELCGSVMCNLKTLNEILNK